MPTMTLSTRVMITSWNKANHLTYLKAAISAPSSLTVPGTPAQAAFTASAAAS